MAEKRKAEFLAPPQTQREFKALYGRVVKKLTAMSPAERVATMIRADIYTKNRKLTKHYGG